MRFMFKRILLKFMDPMCFSKTCVDFSNRVLNEEFPNNLATLNSLEWLLYRQQSGQLRICIISECLLIVEQSFFQLAKYSKRTGSKFVQHCSFVSMNVNSWLECCTEYRCLTRIRKEERGKMIYIVKCLDSIVNILIKGSWSLVMGMYTYLQYSSRYYAINLHSVYLSE